MKSSSPLSKLQYTWGYNADSSTTRTIPQTTTDTAAASWALGFPSATFTPPSSGGSPPNGMDFNGVLTAISTAVVGIQSQGVYAFDSSFASSIGGYPNRALVADPSLSGVFWQSTIDNNTNALGSTNGGWNPIQFNNFVQKTGDTMSGALTVDMHGGSDSNGQIRWGGFLQSQILGYESSSASLCIYETVNQTSFAKIKVTGSGGVATDFNFIQNSGRIDCITSSQTDNPTINTVAFVSDIQSAIAPLASVSQLPMSPNDKIEFFTASGLGNGNTWVTFPSAFSSAPIVIVGALGQNGNSTDTDYFVWGADGSGVNINPRNVTSQVQIIAIGPK